MTLLPLWDPGASLDPTPALDLLERLVRIESPSSDPASVQAVLFCYAEALESVGARVAFLRGDGSTWTPACAEPPILQADMGPSGPSPLLVAGHGDTVHPHGTLAGPLPYAIVGEGPEARIQGPGVYDMKGGLALMWGAVHALHFAGASLPRPVRFLVTPDEEVGSNLSRAFLEAQAPMARAALIPEPSLPNGHAKLRRKGVGEYRLRLEGIPAHAGIEPEKGASAIHAMAEVILKVVGLADPGRGTTLNVGRVHGGTANNVVAAEAELTIDLRMREAAEAERVDAEIRRLAVSDPRIRLRIDGGINRLPMEAGPESLRLLAAASAEAAALGVPDFGGGETGGASDGNLLSAAGCPVLDGLGPVGAGAHTLTEHILLADVPWRIRFYARLLQCL
jgi:glutamate carboxypeptidase